MIELCPELRDYFKGADAFDEVLNLDGKVYRLHKNRRTLRIERNGKGYFVKIHRRIGWGRSSQKYLQPQVACAKRPQ